MKTRFLLLAALIVALLASFGMAMAQTKASNIGKSFSMSNKDGILLKYTVANEDSKGTPTELSCDGFLHAKDYTQTKKLIIPGTIDHSTWKGLKVTIINKDAFGYVKDKQTISLKGGVSIPSTVKIVGNNAFYSAIDAPSVDLDLSALKDVIIGEYAFSRCTMKRVIMPNNMKKKTGKQSFWVSKFDDLVFKGLRQGDGFGDHSFSEIEPIKRKKIRIVTHPNDEEYYQLRLFDFDYFSSGVTKDSFDWNTFTVQYTDGQQTWGSKDYKYKEMVTLGAGNEHSNELFKHWKLWMAGTTEIFAGSSKWTIEGIFDRFHGGIDSDEYTEDFYFNESVLEFKSVLDPAITITFDANGGTGTMSAIKVIANQQVGALPANKFTRDGYTFLGWAYDKNATEEDRGDMESLDVDAVDFTLYAIWKKNEAKAITIAFNANGGTGAMPNIVLSDFHPVDEVVQLTFPNCEFMKDGYTFVGWGSSAATEIKDAIKPEEKKLFKSTYVGKTITFYAIWEAVPAADMVTITFNANGGKGAMSTQVVEKGAIVSLKKNTFTLEGDNFKGWSTDKNADSVADIDFNDGESITINNNLTLYAVWGITVGVEEIPENVMRIVGREVMLSTVESLMIVDLSGRQIYTGRTDRYTFNAAGIYIIVVDGKTKKIMIK